MRIGFVVNQIETEQATYTTTRLAMAAVNRGHEAWLIGTGDLALDPDDYVRARARSAPKAKYKSLDTYLDEVRGPHGRAERITVDDLDVLMLRNDPAEDIGRRTWAQMAGILFGRAALRRGVIVLNDPTALALAANKMYFQLFPEEVRPATLITRDRNEIRHFAQRARRRRGDQAAARLRRPGRVPGPQKRPGQPQPDDRGRQPRRLRHRPGIPAGRRRGRHAAVRDERRAAEIQGQISRPSAGSAPATTSAAISTPAAARPRPRSTTGPCRIVEIVRPKLVADGMFLVGLDIVGDKLMEINVFSPGGLGSAQSFEGVNFAAAVIMALERKVQYMGYYQRNFNNIDMATL